MVVPTTTPTQATIRSISAGALAAALRVEGYRPVAPSRLAAAADREACAGQCCAACGARGLVYEPWSKPGNYRPIARCRACGAEEEF